VGFYLVMIGMPLTGWLTVSTSRIQVPTLLYGVIPWPHLPLVSHLAPAAKAAWNTLGGLAHESLAWGLYVLVALHVAGALKHQLFSRDEPVLGRMAPGAVPGRWLEPRLMVVALAFAGVIAFGELVQPPVPAMAAAPSPISESAPVADVAPAAAAPAPQAPASPAAPELVRWRVGPGSTLGFTTAWSGAPIQGRFDKWRAGIVFSPELLDQSKVTATIDLASVNTGDKQRDETLPSGDWFDAAAHPQAEFRANRFEKTGEGRYVAHGTLSLKGVTKPLDLPFRLKIDGQRAEMSGTASLDRTVFGIGQGEFAATDQIPAKVTVRVELHAIRD
jgi:polyisoprenoid-binding protein YceI